MSMPKKAHKMLSELVNPCDPSSLAVPGSADDGCDEVCSNSDFNDDACDDDDDEDFTPEELESIYHNSAKSVRNFLITGKPFLFTIDGQPASHELCMSHAKFLIENMDPYWINRYLKNLIY